jgi:hypothetical protein
VDSNAQVRIFSLVTLQFRFVPSPLHQSGLPCRAQRSLVDRRPCSSKHPPALYTQHQTDLASSCFMLTISGPSLTAYHLETFGLTEGIAIDVPDFPLEGAVLTSIVNRGRVFFIGLDIHAQAVKSVAIDITKKVTEFTFKQKGSKKNTRTAQHNSLLDCHAEVWTRFPVLPAVKRRTTTRKRWQKTLTFVADDITRPFASYFSDLVQTFEETMRKPTGDELSSIKVSAAQFRRFWTKVLSQLDWKDISLPCRGVACRSPLPYSDSYCRLS